MMAGVATIRDTVLGRCIGATILDITAVDTEDFLAGAPPYVYFHLSNGETIFAMCGVTGKSEGLLGMLGEEDDEEDDAEHSDL
jgi:hypothetical protein